ncbi:hypothetical protein OUZ56_005594 [Daphnia magna]|uniref:Peptidase A2 domain-containing protein n=1 Tax=Daphnia magna TaxID=35525 RepID=A0ABQ9YTX5_9CRUS|nr:hypothetical protein OUZ56_005594 [Daphnia magna]
MAAGLLKTSKTVVQMPDTTQWVGRHCGSSSQPATGRNTSDKRNAFHLHKRIPSRQLCRISRKETTEPQTRDKLTRCQILLRDNKPMPIDGPKHVRKSKTAPPLRRTKTYISGENLGPTTQNLHRFSISGKEKHRNSRTSMQPRMGRPHASRRKGERRGNKSRSSEQRTTNQQRQRETFTQTAARSSATTTRRNSRDEELWRKEGEKPSRQRDNKKPVRTADRRTICSYCKGEGHIKRYFPKKREDGDRRNNTTVAMISTSDEEDDKDIPLLQIDAGQLVTEEVKFGKNDTTKKTEAVIDTGAAVSIISPKLTAEIALELKTWGGPQLEMVNRPRTPS